MHVRNFRSLADEEIDFSRLTALVGRDGSGKSTALRALEIFFAPNPRCDEHDFYDRDTMKQVEIEITFANLRDEELKRFARYRQGDHLTVTRCIFHSDGKFENKYHGLRLSNQDFSAIRSAPATEGKGFYDGLKKDPRYQDLPAARSKEDRLVALSEWEDNHPESCSPQKDEGQFFGFNEVGQGYLGKFTKFIHVPAVRDASSEAEEGRGSAITEMINLVVRSSLEAHSDIQELKDSTNRLYREIIDPSKLDGMTRLEADLTATLKAFVPDASVHLAWLTGGGIEILMPKADVTLTEDGYRSSVAKTGHGLQRAFILTLLQHLAFTRVSSVGPSEAEQKPESEAPVPAGPDTGGFDLLLGIEEPELYQHPTRQRHLATVLSQLASGNNSVADVTRFTQVIYSTHSPAFVGLDRFNEIRLFRKQQSRDGAPKVTKITATSLAEVAKALWEFHGMKGPQFTAETLKPRLRPLMTPWMNEGFFAEVVVLVEGEEDRAAIIGTALTMGHDPDRYGISIIPCGGKTNLDRPALVFSALGIPVYLVWDSDHGGKEPKPEYNRCLLKIVGTAEEDYPHAIEHDYACFKTTLTDTMREELGEDLFNEIAGALRVELAIQGGGNDIKNPFFVQSLIVRAKERGKTSPSLEAIVSTILAKR